MITKKLFEIPVYALTEEELVKRVNRYKDRLFKNEYAVTSVNYDLLKAICKGLHLWKYNHIVGYIVVIKEGNDIVFELYKTECQKYYWSSSVKKAIYNNMITGYHFRLTDGITNDDIIEKILDYCRDIKERFFGNVAYLDTELFDLYSNCIDFKEV